MNEVVITMARTQAAKLACHGDDSLVRDYATSAISAMPMPQLSCLASQVQVVLVQGQRQAHGQDLRAEEGQAGHSEGQRGFSPHSASGGQRASVLATPQCGKSASTSDVRRPDMLSILLHT